MNVTGGLTNFNVCIMSLTDLHMTLERKGQSVCHVAIHILSFSHHHFVLAPYIQGEEVSKNFTQ